MHSLEPELRLLRDAAEPQAMERALAQESGRLFSVHGESLLVLYGAVAAVIAGVGLLVHNNLDRLGPVTLLLGILAAASGCYAMAVRGKLAGQQRSPGGDYVLLLGALLFSAALGYAETQFHWFGANWSRHLLLLAAWHVASAYWLDSRLVLSVGLTAFAAWLGVDISLGNVFTAHSGLWAAGARSLICAALFASASLLHRRRQHWPDLREVYEQFAINLAFWGALALGFDERTRWLGVCLLTPLAWFVGRAGLAQRREIWLLYAIGYATIGALALEAQLLGGILVFYSGLITILVAVTLLQKLRARLKDME